MQSKKKNPENRKKIILWSFTFCDLVFVYWTICKQNRLKICKREKSRQTSLIFLLCACVHLSYTIAKSPAILSTQREIYTSMVYMYTICHWLSTAKTKNTEYKQMLIRHNASKMHAQIIQFFFRFALLARAF